MDPKSILTALGWEGSDAEPFINAEDGEAYSVWKVTDGNRTGVLKPAKEYEAEVYTTFLRAECNFAPKLLAMTRQDDRCWLLMEYVPGEDLRFCTRAKLIKALDALIEMQKHWWQCSGYEDTAFSMEKARTGRIRRGEDLGDEPLRQAYLTYLNIWEKIPRTLCHEDLLPFNVLIGEDRAVIIDWEYAGMQPYLSSLARLIAHGEEAESAFFHMKAEDRTFAIEYYYEHLVREKGISIDTYRRDLDYFLLYEYCEWIMLGNRYGDITSDRYCRYLALAREHIQHLKEEQTWK